MIDDYFSPISTATAKRREAQKVMNNQFNDISASTMESVRDRVQLSVKVQHLQVEKMKKAQV